MTRARLVVFAMLVALAIGCGSTPSLSDAGPAPSCGPRRGQQPHAPVLADAGADAGTSSVWGAADLHVHPANHLALGGHDDGTGGALWGLPGATASTPGRVWLGPEQSCDGETHTRSASDPATRVTQSLVMAELAADGHRAHAAMYARPHPDDRGTGLPEHELGPFANWPDARDLLHQQLHIDALRRAYDGGLRLMFASVTDSQAFAKIMQITIAPGAIEIDPSWDVRSAERMLRYLRDEMIAHNESWLALATSPDQARDIIRSGRLAVVLALEMDWLPLETVQRFHDDYGVSSIVPIHVVDNAVGGSAAFSPIFNLDNWLWSTNFGTERSYYRVEQTACTTRAVDAPFSVNFQAGLIILPGSDSGLLTTLGYRSTDVCATMPSTRGVDVGDGTRNLLGLRDIAYLRGLMRMGMLIDVAHMSNRAASEAITEAERQHYPVLDTHTGVSPAGQRIGRDGDLPLGLARRIYRNASGVVGFGTGPASRVLHRLFEAYDPRHGLASLMPGGPAADLVPRGAPAAPATPADLVAGAVVCVTGPHTVAPSGLLRVNLCGEASGHGTFDVDLVATGATSCATIPTSLLPTDEIASIEYRASADAWCGATGTSEIASATITAGAGPAHDLALPSAGTSGSPIGVDAVSLLASSGCATVHACSAGPEPAVGSVEPSSRSTGVDATVSGQRVLHVTMHSGADGGNAVRGASAVYDGTQVIVTLDLVTTPPSTIAQTPPSVALSMNHRGFWEHDKALEEWLVVPVDDGSVLSVTGVHVRLVSDDARDAAWVFDHVVVEETEDPIAAWARNYRQLALEVEQSAGAETAIDDVVFAIGTDQSGFASQFPVSGVVAGSPTCRPFQVCDSATGVCTNLSLAERGLANYAMLSDFFDALEVLDDQHPMELSVADRVFSSAEATIHAWELAQARAASVTP